MLPLIFYRIKERFLKISTKWDQLAPDQNHAIEFAHTHINPEPLHTEIGTSPTPEYLLARTGEDLNTKYRNDNIDENYKNIENMISQHFTDTDIVLYRGICDNVLQSMIKNAKKQTDCDLLELGFLQTSLVKGKEIDATHHLRIYVPAKTNVVYLGNINDEEETFYEVDIQHSAKLKIISADPKKLEPHYINCLLIQTD